MRDYKYDITIWPENSPEQFRKACTKLENAYSEVKKDDLLVDVDGSLIQVYSLHEKEIVIYDDYDFGYVFALSDYDIRDALK